MKTRVFKQNDLILKVTNHYDKEKLNLSEWNWFLDVLCGNREYQKEAIINSIVFLASGEYKNTEDLVLENYNKNDNLKVKYSNIKNYLDQLQIKEKLHANIDLATGTGKSYVIYGIAQIMLGLGLVERVLVLCPSTTIESGLIDKFTDLSVNKELRDSIPKSAIIKNPRIIDANQTIRRGDICIENIHAVYTGTGSSIYDSFKDGGTDTLILNDESHHIYNNPQSISSRSFEAQNIKKWKSFLKNKDYNFKYIMGFTGTAYIDNDYFNDVIYRYSLKEAIEDKVVKSIDYVQKDDSGRNINEKFQKIYQNHLENIRKNSKLKPLTILVTKDISMAKDLETQLIKFLSIQEEISRDVVEKKVLLVTSHDEHKENIKKLKYVDEKNNSVEWIISVSMLTEGWDVKNVFQIVPWEDRAFNSKLLIAQVLGRGLRIPNDYQGTQPSVIVFNHDSWSKNIKGLVDEILEIETKITSSVKYEGERNKFNFSVHNLSYKKIEIEHEHDEKHKNMDYSKMWNQGIGLVSQTEYSKKETTFENLIDGQRTEREYIINQEMISVDEVVNKIINEFLIRDWEGGILGLGDDQVYSKENLPSKDKIIEIINKSMLKVGIKGNELTLDNANRIYRSFSTLFRNSSKTVKPETISSEPFEIRTEDMNNESIGFSSFKSGGATVFFTKDYESVTIGEEQQNIFKEFLKDESLPRSASKEVNYHCFKTPQNFVFTTMGPENKFVTMLTDEKNSQPISSWIKSRDKGFYSIEYTYRDSNHQKQKHFNPDFFIKVTNESYMTYIVVEIKADGDDSLENKAKLKYSKKHFETLNKILESGELKEKYIMVFLSPSSYDTFFKYLSDGRLLEGNFKSDLEILLEEE